MDILRECILIKKRGAILDNKRSCELNCDKEQKKVSGSVSWEARELGNEILGELGE